MEEPYYDDTYGGQAVNLSPLPANGTTKKKKKKKRKKKNKPTQEEVVTPKRIDYVLVYKQQDVNFIEEEDDLVKYQKQCALRERFQKAMVGQESLEVEEEIIGEHTYVKVHAPFDRLCRQAENVKLEMPLRGAAIIPNQKKGCKAAIERRLKTDDELDFVSAPFVIQKRNVYHGIQCPETFFRPATRSYLVNQILINMDVRATTDDKDDDSMRRKGLPFMLLRKVYSDAFVLHDESPYAQMDEEERDAARKKSEKEGAFKGMDDAREGKVEYRTRDARIDMQRTWCRWNKYQPLWKIRNYYGEQIAFYFAWAGAFATYLWVPMFLGLAIWGYGLFLSIEDYRDTVEADDAKRAQLAQLTSITNRTPLQQMLFDNLTQQISEQSLISTITDAGLTVFKNSFDSEVTPYYALTICLWGTIFQEIWKRKRVRLAYEWDVDDYDLSEPDRPEFYGTKERPDPVSDLPDWYYPFYKHFLKFMASFGILIFMATLVIVSVISVIIYRLFTEALLADSDTVVQLLVSSLIASLLNSISILILGKIYDKIAVILNDWENHRTKSDYENALIIKLFAFQFVNSYSSLFYIAFFRDQSDAFLGIDGLQDYCTDNNCMSMLSLQVFVLMLVKPFPKTFKDIIIPFVMRKLKKRRCCRGSQVNDMDTENMSPHAQYLMKEKNKPPVGNFTLGEYNEKVILYGFLMLFSAALPLAPLIALCVLLIDIRVDGKRLLWFNRRPVAYIASNIGMWYSILDFINFAGVVSNAFLIAFTAQWGRKYSNFEKLWIVIGFEHLVFGIKFFLMYIIPDVPKDIALAVRRERYQVAKILDDAENEPPLKSKENGCGALPSGHDFLGLNFLTRDNRSGSPGSESGSSLASSCNSAASGHGLYAADQGVDGILALNRALNETDDTPNATQLTYDENGDSYMVDPQPAPLLPPEPPSPKKRKRKKSKGTPRQSSLDPDLPPIQGGAAYSAVAANPSFAYPPNYGFHPSVAPGANLNITASSNELLPYPPLPAENTFQGPF